MKTQTIKARYLFIITILSGIVFLLSGCATNLESDVAPGVNLTELETVFVQKLPADGRGVEKLIAEELTRMGFKASYGPELPADQTFDAMVTYQDKWMWDITMYMIELRIQVLNPESRFVMASGQSFRTSLARKSPPEMVKEVLSEIFKETARE